MNTAVLILTGVGLAMDAFAVAVCKGLSMKKLDIKKMIIIGLYFGSFQALMPFLGYMLGLGFQEKIKSIDHWVAFGLLTIIGVNMIKEALCGEEEAIDHSVCFKVMIVLAVATSIDALAIGVTFAFLNVNILLAIVIIGVVTLLISMAGVGIGNVFGTKFKGKAEIAGGVILILLGIKILIEHLGINT